MASERSEGNDLLRGAVRAARSGQMDEARVLLLKAVEARPHDASAWLWLAGVERDPRRQEVYLQKVLDLDPENARARQGLFVVRKQAARALLEAGITAANLGEREVARDMLTQAVQRDEHSLDAWLWLSRVLDRPEDREICFENVLSLDPTHREAREEMALLQQARLAATEEPWIAAEPQLEPAAAAQAAMPERESDEELILYEPDPSAVESLWATYDDELICPYCAAPTVRAQRRCGRCGNRLWVRVRRRETRSVLLWIALALQVLNILGALLAPVAIVGFVAWRMGIRDFTRLLPAYIGGAVNLPPSAVDVALRIWPRWAFFASWGPLVLALLFWVALYLRWSPVWYLMALTCVAGVFTSLVSLVLQFGAGPIAIALGAAGALISLLGLLLVLRMEDDFRRDRVRILTRIEGELKGGVAFLAQGRKHAQAGLWALAALYFRRATVLLPHQVDGYIALAQAAAKLGATEIAYQALSEASRIEPDSQQIAEVLAVLKAQTAAPAIVVPKPQI